MDETRNLGFNEKEMGLLCYHHMVATRFLDERHQMQRMLGLTTPENDKNHIESMEVAMSISDKLETFIEHTGIGELLSNQIDKLFLKKKEVEEVTRIIKDLENGKSV